ncbi:MAG TPA: ATP-binding cassette domain-containing protein, partial [Soehngenia sp.]|nr:ATP-binding cassette domain-containing protein [Soehngenia sp.]
MIINIENLNFIYNIGTPFEKKALDDISISIEEGDFVGLIGHTGSGKSTLVQHLNGLIKPTSGKIIVDGVDITNPETKMKEIRKKVGLVFQYPEHQLFEETIYKDIAFGPKNLGLTEEEIELRVRDAMELVGLDYDT